MQRKWDGLCALATIVSLMICGGMAGVVTGIAAHQSHIAGSVAFVGLAAILGGMTYALCNYIGGSLSFFGHRRNVTLGWFDGMRPYLIRRAWLWALVIEAFGMVLGYSIVSYGVG